MIILATAFSIALAAGVIATTAVMWEALKHLSRDMRAADITTYDIET